MTLYRKKKEVFKVALATEEDAESRLVRLLNKSTASSKPKRGGDGGGYCPML